MAQDMMQEEPRKMKVDITSNVIGKIYDNNLVFFVGDRDIGQMSLSSDTPEYTFKDGFGIEDHKIFQIQTVGVVDDQYVDGCEMGWC